MSVRWKDNIGTRRGIVGVRVVSSHARKEARGGCLEQEKRRGRAGEPVRDKLVVVDVEHEQENSQRVSPHAAWRKCS